MIGALSLIGLSGCGGGKSSSADTGDTVAGNQPVTLEGKVNDHGTKELGSAGDVDVEIDDSYFAPTFIQADPGTVVTVKLENEGSKDHTFTIDDTDIDQQLAPGSDAEVQVTVPESGSLRFYCRFHHNAGMQGAFFTAAGASTPAQTATTQASSSRGGYGY
jgi:plastocyanin